MKKLLCLYFALFAILTSFAAKLPSSFEQKEEVITETNNVASTLDEALKPSSAKAFSQLSVSELQKSLGRRLTLKEKTTWALYKKHLISIEPTEREKKNANTNAILGLVFGILGIVIFPLFAIPGLILSNKALTAEKADPGILAPGNRGIAVAGQITSYVALALIVVAFIIVIAVLASWH